MSMRCGSAAAMALVAFTALLGALPIDTAEAEGRRVVRSQLSQSQASRTRLATPRLSQPRRTATRGVVRRVAVSRSAGSGTRVAGFVQRAPANVGRRLALANGARRFNSGAPATFINGYRETTGLEFKTGDFFDKQQRIGTQ